VRKSLESFERALALAPELASAHACRDRAYHFLAALGRSSAEARRRPRSPGCASSSTRPAAPPS
jgi:hypothetical protein